MFEIKHEAPRTTRWWYRQRENLDMDPEYQRKGSLWGDEDQKFLIDTIINGYDIPKLYVADFTTLPSPLNLERMRYAVIDGKQRFHALFKFFSNELPLSRNFVLTENPNLPLQGLLYRDLEENHPEIAARVEDFHLSVVHVVTDEEEKINELFVRLNKGLALTGAEQRNAMIGPVPKAIRRIANHEFFTRCVRFTTKRGQGLNAAAKILLTVIRGEITDTKKRDLDRLAHEFEQHSFNNIEPAVEEANSVLDRMSAVFSETDELLAAQGSVLIYYLFFSRIGRDQDRQARSFLSRFTTELKLERNKPEDQKDRQFLSYELASRSTNDARAISTRLDILLDRF